MKKVTPDATKLRPKNGGTVKPVATPEYKKVISPTKNVIRTKEELGPKHETLKKSTGANQSRFGRKPLARFYFADILRLNRNIRGHRGFEGSHLSHFLKAMEDHSLNAKKAEKLRIKPACEGLSRYVSMFDCER